MKPKASYMSDIVIRAENISKRYLLGHQANAPKGEITLRDNLLDAARGLLRRTKEMARGGALVAGDSVEEFWALKDVSFEVKRGEMVGIIGRNGAGKSTLLKILSRITEPTSGRITLNGRVSSLLEVGTGFHPELSGRENIFLNGAILGMSRKEIQAKFDEIVDFAEVEKFLDTPVKRYSSGMYVRLAFAVAAHLEPEILIVDEVLAVGDVQFQKKCLGKMQSVAGQGRTILFVSHNIAAIKSLCDRAVLLVAGVKSADGAVEPVVGEYLSQLGARDGEFRTLVVPKADVLGIWLCDAQGRELRSIDTDTEIHFTIDYRVKETGRVNMVLNLSKDGAFVFQSINNHDPSYAQTKFPGVYRSICCLPDHYLNNGLFTLSMTVFEENYANPATFLDILSFSVLDGIGVRGDYFGGLLGVTRPLLAWTTAAIQ